MEELRDRILSIKHYKKYITKTRITKNGLFIYGGYYSTSYGEKHPVYTYISNYDKSNVNYILDLLDTFAEEVERLVF